MKATQVESSTSSIADPSIVLSYELILNAASLLDPCAKGLFSWSNESLYGLRRRRAISTIELHRDIQTVYLSFRYPLGVKMMGRRRSNELFNDGMTSAFLQFQL